MQHKCYKCGTEFDGNFCPECGEKWLENKTCPKCGATLAGTAKFCNECGFSFAPKPPAPRPALGAPKPQTVPFAPSAPVPPRNAKPQKPQKVAKLTQRDTVPKEKREELMPEMDQYCRMAQKRLGLVLLFLSFCFILPMFLSIFFNEQIFYLGDLHDFLNKTETFFLIAEDVVYLTFFIAAIVVLVQSKKKRQYGWHPEKVYSNTLYQALYVLLIMRLCGFLLYFVWFQYRYITALRYDDYNLFYPILYGCFLLPLAITMLVFAVRGDKKLAQKRTELSIKLCGFAHPSHNAELVEQYQKELAASVTQKPKKNLPLIRRDIATAEERKELWPAMAKHIKQKRIVATLFFMLLFVSAISGMVIGRFVKGFDAEILLYCFLVGFYITAMLIVAFLACRTREWRPDKIYRYKTLRNSIIIFLSLFFAVTLFCIIMCSVTAKFFVKSFLLMFLGGLIDLVVTVLLYRKLAKQRKELCLKLCGYDTPTKNKEFAVAYQADYVTYFEQCRQNHRQKAEYRGNRRAWTVYEYQKKRYDRGKTYQNITYPRAWLYFHRVALSAASVTLAAVITVTCVLATRDTRFNIDNLVKIGLSADQQAVTEVLGDPFEKQGDVWYYFSKNYMSIQEKMDKAMESDSIEDALEESAALEEKLQTLEYQAIIVRFSGNKVTSMMLDAAAVGSSKLLGVPHEKEVVEQSLSKTSFRLGDTADSAYYTVSYSDGSYCMAYLPAIQLTEEGEQTIKWTNVWGTYTATVTVRK